MPFGSRDFTNKGPLFVTRSTIFCNLPHTLGTFNLILELEVQLLALQLFFRWGFEGSNSSQMHYRNKYETNYIKRICFH